MKVRLSKPVSVEGVTWQPGEYEIADPHWARQVQQMADGEPEKMGAALEAITMREDQNALRYANMAKLAALEAELTRREQWAPVNYRQIREAEVVRSGVMSMGALREDIAALRDDLERGSVDPAWDERTAMYHPDRTEAMPADIAGIDARALNPSVEATVDQGDYRSVDVAGAGRVQSSHITRATDAFAKEQVARPGESHPGQVLEGDRLAKAKEQADKMDKAREAERANIEASRVDLAKSQTEQQHQPSGQGSPSERTEAAREETKSAASNEPKDAPPKK